MSKEMMSLKDREYNFFSDGEAIQKVCAHVSMGGSLIDLAETLGINYAGLLKWIRSESNRNKAYDQALEDRKEWAKEKIFKLIMDVSSADIRQLYDDEGKLLHPKKWPSNVAAAVTAVETLEVHEGIGQDREYIGDTKRVKLVDKNRSIELVMKHLSMLVEKHEHKGSLTLEQLVRESKKDDKT
jgi:hypothetical protein